MFPYWPWASCPELKYRVVLAADAADAPRATNIPIAKNIPANLFKLILFVPSHRFICD